MLVGQSRFLSVALVSVSYPPKALHFFFTLIYGRQQEKLFTLLRLNTHGS